LSLAVVVGFYWLAGVGNGFAHLFAPSSAPFVCITKPGRFSTPGSPKIFQREHVTTAFYTRSGGLKSKVQQITKYIEHLCHMLVKAMIVVVKATIIVVKLKY
jgi:hypothetical protein